MYLVSFYENEKVTEMRMFDKHTEAIYFAKNSYLEKYSDVCEELSNDLIDKKNKIAHFSNKKNSDSCIVFYLPKEEHKESIEESIDESIDESIEESEDESIEDTSDIDINDIDVYNDIYLYDNFDKYDSYSTCSYEDECYDCLDL
jgi:hypothetical protein